MFLYEMQLSGFRNLEPQRIPFVERVTVITGRNGQGKTSLLEAIYLLSHNKSFRTAKLRDLIRWHSPNEVEGGGRHEGCTVTGRLRAASGEKTVGYEIAGGKRQVLINGKKAEKPSSFYGQLTTVVFTPEELELVRGAPQTRRNFLDRTLAMVNTGFVEHAVHYQRALKNRNALLHGRKSGNQNGESLRQDLVFWDVLLVRHGLEVARSRAAFIDILRKQIAAYHADICGELPEAESEKISLCYESDFVQGRNFKAETELLADYARHFEKDQKYGLTTFGVHRDDIQIELDTGFGAKKARTAASQGQARTAALALKLCAIDFIVQQTGEAPILLLDDVESELDAARRGALFQLLDRFASQVIITTTEVSREIESMGKERGYYEISQGLAKPLSNPKFRA